MSERPESARAIDADEYQRARLACELARNILREYDFARLIQAIDHAGVLGPILDPTAWLERSEAMLEDRAVFAGAAKLLAAWKGDGNAAR